ncbi:dentin sialophosphoprotein isoform X6 [Spodoptera frugiperda]|uniref:Dentin sialophosphoprotein isoform X6 n=1 Tax=Spodoptera frugiperda TaxID=7108 RepID=A0A9R0EX84_SPOFR|nr:dentin sialophosphoprotein isoform X6 [Spodoptera frugiperda]
MDYSHYDKHGNVKREDPSTSQPRPGRPKSRWDEDVYGPWVPVEPTRPNEVVQVAPQSSDTNYNEQYYYQDYYSPYYNLVPNNNATDSVGYYSSNPYNTFNQNYDTAASMSEYLYENQLPVNHGGYHSMDQPGSSAQSHQGSYCYTQRESYDKRKNKERNRATITERRKKNHATDSRGRTTRRKNGEREKDKPSRKTVVKKEIKSEPTTNTLQEEILNTKRKQLLKQINRSSRKERRKKTRSASEKNRQKKIKTFNRQCRSFTRKVLISKDKKYRSLSPASYQRYLDFQRFLINHYTSVSKYRVKRKKCIQRKNKKLINIQKKKDKQIESLNQQSSNEKIHETEESSDESSDEENTQGEQDKNVPTEQVTESKSSRKRPRSKSPKDSEKAKDENDNQENTKNENSKTPSKRFVKVKLNINIENPSCASDCSESCATMENLSFVEEIDVDKIIKLLNMDPNQETVSTEDTRGNARNEETLSQNNLTKDDLPNDNTSDDNEHHQANQTNKSVPSSDHEIIDLTVGEPAKDSSQNKAVNKQNQKPNKVAPKKNPKESGETMASKAKPNNPNQKDGTNSQQSKKETVKDNDSSKNNSSRNDSTKYDSSRKDSTKNNSSRNDSTKYDSSRKDSTKNDSSRKDSTRNDSRKKYSTRNDSSRRDSTRNDSSRRDSTRNDSSRKDSTRNDSSRKDSTKNDSSRKDPTKNDKSSRKDNSKEDESRTNTSNSDRDKTRRSEKRRSSDDGHNNSNTKRTRDSKHNDKSKSSDGKTRSK